MALQILDRLQSGQLSGGVWTDTNIPTLGGASEAWIQFDASALVTEVPSGLSIVLTPLFNETATLTVLYQPLPITTDFVDPSYVPSGVEASSSTVDLVAGVGGTAIPIPLYDSNGKATALGAGLRAARIADVAGVYRAAIGMRWSGTGGVVSLTLPTLSFTPDFGGDSRLWSPPNTDRAVQCPRCGTAWLESNLTRDGVLTGLYVCPECYDPPKEPDTFKWPFRG